MPRRSVTIDGERWQVYLSGRVTSYNRDEMGLVFEKGTGPDRERRVTRFSPLAARTWDAALTDLSDDYLHQLFHHSQHGRTSPEITYGRPKA